ncbi:hypothetical protein MCEMIH15_01917 [Caulobacteraceae bacterium]
MASETTQHQTSAHAVMATRRARLAPDRRERVHYHPQPEHTLAGIPEPAPLLTTNFNSTT